MRRFLMVLGSYCLGFASILVVFGIVYLNRDASPVAYRSSVPPLSTGESIIAMFAVYLIALVLGMALSAPYAIDPPDTQIVFGWLVPIVFVPVIWAFKLVDLIGYLQLKFCWWLLSLLWHRVRPLARQQPSPPAPYGPGPYSVPQQAGPVGPSWQRDPSGRYPQRYWNGQAWTEHVANAGVVMNDPL
ncbi:DUF2510 domain-containing protein [Catellatospora sp. NPDC049609]|uniref:DUF2510 domain-containing protein n=1 Tax=Catellatospora sp. NPDC049609 TaxID=3155505 RepID=UPI00341F4F58